MTALACSLLLFCSCAASYRRGQKCVTTFCCFRLKTPSQSLCCRPKRTEMKEVFCSYVLTASLVSFLREVDEAGATSRLLGVAALCGTQKILMLGGHGWLRVLTRLLCACVRVPFKKQMETQILSQWTNEYPKSFGGRPRSTCLTVFLFGPKLSLLLSALRALFQSAYTGLGT